MSESEVTVERLTEYSDEDAAGIGALMPFLSDRLPGTPTERKLLEEIINSKNHAQFVARYLGRIVAAASLSKVRGPTGVEAHLGDFVVHPDARNQGVGGLVWDQMVEWCLEEGIDDLSFTSNSSRAAAWEFYRRHGAEQLDTTAFHARIRRQPTES